MQPQDLLPVRPGTRLHQLLQPAQFFFPINDELDQRLQLRLAQPPAADRASSCRIGLPQDELPGAAPIYGTAHPQMVHRVRLAEGAVAVEVEALREDLPAEWAREEAEAEVGEPEGGERQGGVEGYEGRLGTGLERVEEVGVVVLNILDGQLILKSEKQAVLLPESISLRFSTDLDNELLSENFVLLSFILHQSYQIKY